MTTRPTPVIRRTAHDSGDGMTVAHCFSCGGGQVVGRSDGTVECQYCGIAFTVQVQPLFSGFPQTVDGQPFPIPGMPGQIGGPPAAPGAADPGMDGGNPFADDGDPDADPGQEDAPEDAGDPFASGGQDPAAGPPADGGQQGPPPAKKDKKKSSRVQPARYATANGAYLSPERFTQYLAIRHAVNAELDPLLESIRARNNGG